MLGMESARAAALVQAVGVCSSDFCFPPWLVQGAKTMASVGTGNSFGHKRARCMS